MAQSIREIIQTTEALEIGDEVKFTDDEETEHKGEIVETNRKDEHQDFLVKTAEFNTADRILEVWYDPEGGPVTVKVSSCGDHDTREITHIETVN